MAVVLLLMLAAWLHPLTPHLLLWATWCPPGLLVPASLCCRSGTSKLTGSNDFSKSSKDASHLHNGDILFAPFDPTWFEIQQHKQQL